MVGKLRTLHEVWNMGGTVNTVAGDSSFVLSSPFRIPELLLFISPSHVQTPWTTRDGEKVW